MKNLINKKINFLMEDFTLSKSMTSKSKVGIKGCYPDFPIQILIPIRNSGLLSGSGFEIPGFGI